MMKAYIYISHTGDKCEIKLYLGGFDLVFLDFSVLNVLV